MIDNMRPRRIAPGVTEPFAARRHVAAHDTGGIVNATVLAGMLRQMPLGVVEAILVPCILKIELTDPCRQTRDAPSMPAPGLPIHNPLARPQSTQSNQIPATPSGHIAPVAHADRTAQTADQIVPLPVRPHPDRCAYAPARALTAQGLRRKAGVVVIIALRVQFQKRVRIGLVLLQVRLMLHPLHPLLQMVVQVLVMQLLLMLKMMLLLLVMVLQGRLEERGRLLWGGHGETPR